MLGNQLKEYRKKKGYTQEEAADELGVVRQTISKWEHETAVSDADMLQKLANLYEVSVSDLLHVSPEQVQEPDRLAEELEKLNDSMAKQLAAQNVYKYAILVIYRKQQTVYNNIMMQV
jgi:putative transcriptional regulator